MASTEDIANSVWAEIVPTIDAILGTVNRSLPPDIFMKSYT